MGIGDEIMASGNAKKAFAADSKNRRVIVTDLRGRPRWSAMWQGVKWMATLAEVQEALRTGRIPADLQTLRDGPRCRPYIDYVKGFTRATGMNLNEGYAVRDNPGFIQLTEAEMGNAATLASMFGAPFVILEPYVKPGANPNKQWGLAGWQSLADLLNREGLNPVQMTAPNYQTVRLQGVTKIATQDFRYGVALMKFARWSFLPDGGLHHAAGALGIPATVLWGGGINPKVLGYANHENIWTPPGCGKWTPCAHCRAVWSALTAEEVFERTKGNPQWKS